MNSLKKTWTVSKEAYHVWSDNKASQMAAALSYYTIFSLAPFLVIIIFIIGMVYGEQSAQEQVMGQMKEFVGEEGAAGVQAILQSANKRSTGIAATAISALVIIFGATNVFMVLQDTLNNIWDVEPEQGGGIMHFLKTRAWSATIVIGIGVMLLLLFVLSAAISGAGRFVGDVFPGFSFVLQAADFVLSFIIITFFFALLFKFLPDAEITWKDVMIGSALTSVLFVIGKLLIGLYLGRASFSSAYGAVGSIIVLIVFVYYSAQILYFGAAFTRVYANRFGSRIKPAPEAVSSPN